MAETDLKHVAQEYADISTELDALSARLAITRRSLQSLLGPVNERFDTVAVEIFNRQALVATPAHGGIMSAWKFEVVNLR